MKKKPNKKTAPKPVVKKLPPPPPKKLPPPPPPKPKLDDFPPNSVLKQLPHRPTKATVIQYTREATAKEPHLVVIVPANCYGDFSSFTTGTVRWGYMRGPDEVTDFVPLDAEGNIDGFTDPVPPASRIKPPPPPKGNATEADLPAKVLKPKAPREGVCAFIDALIMEGKRTAEEVRDLTLAKFPGRDPNATLATVRTRPSHIKAKGLVPPAFKK